MNPIHDCRLVLLAKLADLEPLPNFQQEVAFGLIYGRFQTTHRFTVGESRLRKVKIDR